MEEFSNVRVYNDDLEIIEILRPLKPLPEMGNKPILKYLQENSQGKNLTCTFLMGQEVFTLIKFDKDRYDEGDFGLVLMVSDPLYADLHIQLLEEYQKRGGSLSEKILDPIKAQLEIYHEAARFARVFKQP